MRSKSYTNDDRRGIALLMVIVIVVLLAIVAVPFAMSMRMEFKGSSTFVYEVQARFAARGALQHAVHDLYKTHESLEGTGQLPEPFNTPEFDGAIEMQVDHAGIVDPKTNVRWATRIEDEQGKVNLNSASPWLIGNLLASAVAAQTIDAGSTDIVVDPESAGMFPQAGGMLWVSGELISYRMFDGSTFSGCQRGVNAESPEFLDAKKIVEGQLIIDARAYLLAKLPYEVYPGRFFYYRTLEEMRTIAEQKAKTDEAGRSAFLDASLTPQEFERIKPLVTVHSWRPSGEGWIRTQTILNDLPTTRAEDKPEAIAVTFPHFYPPGSIVRISQGEQVDYAMVLGGTYSDKTNKGYIIINKKPTAAYTRQVAKIAMYEPHAVNINTAHPKVLYALFKGVGLGIRGLGYRRVVVSPAQANAIAGAITKAIVERGAIRNAYDLRKVLSEEVAEEFKLSGRQVNAIMANAAYRGMGMRIRTAPVTYKSGNVYTIEATGIVGGSKGRELARHTIKEIVAVSPPMVSQWMMGGQADFRREMNRTFNNHVNTWPRFISQYDLKFNYLKPPEEGAEEVEEGQLRLKAMELFGTEKQIEHFRNSHEGAEIKGPVPMSGLFGKKPKLQRQLQIPTGSVSFFMKIKSADGVRQYILDVGQKEWENRLSCYYDSEHGELVLEVADATIEPTKAQIRYKMKPEENVWYHLAVVWKSTWDGQLALFLDGRPVGDFTYYNNQSERIGTYLTGDVDEQGGTIQVKSTAGFPDQGALRIGAEVVEYESKTSNSFTVRTQWASGGFRMQYPGRGARGTAALAHAQDCRVVPWGYSVPLKNKNDFFIGGARLKGDFPKSKFTNILMTKKSPNDPRKIGPPRFMDKDTEMEVADTDGFPDKGILAVFALGKPIEYIYYSGKQDKKFTGLQRGLEGSAATTYPNGSIVYPISMWVDQHTEYPASGMVQLKNEWVGYDKKNTTDGENFLLLMTGLQSLLTALLAGNDMLHPLRGVAFTAAEDQTAGTKVIPTYEVPMSVTGLPTGSGLQPRPLGRYDRVTLINNNKNDEKEEKVVWWQFHFTGDPDTPNDDKYYVSFNDFVSRKYVYNRRGLTRVLKFPTGELPNAFFKVYACGKNPDAEEKGGSVTIVADEVLTEQYGLPGPFFLTAPVDATAVTLPVVGINLFPKQGSVIRIGNEFMAYTGVQVVDRRQQLGNLTGVKRGFLGTPQTAHAAGAPVMNIVWCRVGALGGEMTDGTDVFSVANGNRFPLEGYLLIGEELVSYSYRRGNTFYMPKNREGNGCFRGRFGTDKAAHEAGDVAYYIPARYPDRYTLEADTPDMAFFQARWSAPSSRFFRLTWDANLHKSDKLEVHALVRFDGKPAWDAKPVIDPDSPQPGQLILFTTGDGANKLNGIIADRVEVRFLFKYKKEVLTTRFWKETPWLRSFKLHYATGPSVLHRETSR